MIELLTFALLCTHAGLVDSIATNRVNIVEDRPVTAEGATAAGPVCDSGLKVTPTQKESTLIWDLGDIYMLHEITITFESAEEAAVVQEVSGKIGFADSNFFTDYKQVGQDDPSSDKIVLRPRCFKENQWGASGSTLKLQIRAKRAFTIHCLEPMGVVMHGKNPMMGKPVKAEDKSCSAGLHLLNDVFEDGYLNYKQDPLNLMVDLGKVFKPTRMDVNMKGEWSDGATITLMPNYYQGNLVTSCKEKRSGRYECPLEGKPVRYVAIEGEESLPKITEVKLLLP